MSEQPVPVINLEGTPETIGEAHGEALRDAVQEHADRNLEWILSESSVELNEDRLREFWAPFLAANETAIIK